MAPSADRQGRAGESAPDRYDAAYGSLRREWADLGQRLPRLQARRALIGTLLEEMVDVASQAGRDGPPLETTEPTGDDDAPVGPGGSAVTPGSSLNGHSPVDPGEVIRRLGEAPLSSSLMGAFGALLVIQIVRGESDATAREVANVNGAADHSAAASIHTYLKRLEKIGLVEQVPDTKPLRFRLPPRVMEATQQT
jgi:hypothetical protein